MLAIESIEYYVPTSRATIAQLQTHLNFSDEMVKIFELFYGIKQVSICKDVSLPAMLSNTLEKLFDHYPINPNQIDYLIYTHTSRRVIPFGRSVVQELKQQFGMRNATAFGTTMQKCAASIKMFEVLATLLSSDKKSYAVLLTGEISFTPALRLVPRSAIAGDAAAVALISNQGDNHRLLAVESRLLPGFSKGIYLSDQELQQFEEMFLDTMQQTIAAAVTKAGLHLDQIKLILPHNVNHATWKKLAAGLTFPLKNIFTDNISDIGHCFTSDGLLNIATAQAKNRLKKGDYYLMVACGMGFFFACAVFQY